MELVRLKDEGVLSVWALKQAEYRSAQDARQRVLDAARSNGRAATAEESAPVKMNPTPVWQRVTGLLPEKEWRLRPVERRGALMRLARVVERMVRSEWKRVLEPSVAQKHEAERGDRFGDSEDEARAACRFATRTSLWDPVSEICFYLEIAQTKLSELLRQATGLRARELSDCVRAENLRKDLKERMRKSARAWLNNEFMTKDYRPLAKMLAEDGRAIVLREYRASDGFMDRAELAQSCGLTRARLYRAVRVCENMELEALERAVALEVFLELLPDIWAGCEVGDDERRVLAERVKSEVEGMKLRTD
jgi:DNA-binding phage protein